MTICNDRFRIYNRKIGSGGDGGGGRDEDLVARIGPRSEFEETRLYVQREIFNVNVTGRLVGGRWLPSHQSVVMDDGFRVEFQLVVAVGAVFITIVSIPHAIYIVQNTKVGKKERQEKLHHHHLEMDR